MKKIIYILLSCLIISLYVSGTTKDPAKGIFTLSIDDPPLKAGIGSYLSFSLAFTNNTDIQQSLSYYKPNFWYPVITEVSSGKVIEITSEVYDGPVVKITRDVAPGESAITESWPVHLLDHPTDLNESKMVCNPGKYKVYFKLTVEIKGQELTLVSDTKEIILSK